MLVRTVEGRNEAWRRENVARARTHELEFYVEDLEEHNTYLHEKVHRLSNLLGPNHEPQADAMDLGVIFVDGSESEEEEEEKEFAIWIFWGKSKEAEGDLSSSKS